MAELGKFSLTLAMTTWTVACAAVLDIEDAEEDPTLSSTGTGGRNGTGGEGGSPSGGAGNQGGEATGGADAGQPKTLCQTYCETVQANCPEGTDLEVYDSMDLCLDTCATLPPGREQDQSGNSVHCRLKRARLAVSSERALNCSVAGPGGSAEGQPVCGSNCEGYCATVRQVCDEAFPDADGLQQCIAECETLEDLGGYNSHDEALQQGDTVQCRLYHTGAATQDAAFHCVHARGLLICTP